MSILPGRRRSLRTSWTTPPGTRPRGRITLEAAREAGHAVIRVRDNGIGIPPEELRTIFEMFHQVKRLDRPVGGLGIGLVLVHRLVEMHGGGVEVRSAGVGQGAEFIVRLPLADAVHRLRTETASQAPVTGRQLRVLVVDDSVDLVEVLGALIVTLGHDVRKAFDGRSAVSAAPRSDVVLLDLGLPGMDGVEVARTLRQIPETRNARLIAMTGWGQEADRRKTTEAGFDAHLTKPADVAVLKRLLGEISAGLISERDTPASERPPLS